MPTGSRTAYLTSNYWRQFLEIVEFDLPTHQLTYVVDGVEYKIYTIEEDALITPEPEPTKEGYTFSGWIGLSEIMPEHDVIVEGIFTKITMAGDANGDGTINVADIVEVINHIKGNPSAVFNASAADMNKDNVVNYDDLMKIVDIIMNVE